jgi:hypothetical protein
MLWKITALALCAVMVAAAAPAPKPAAKVPAKAAAARPGAARPRAAAGAPFDARDPGSLVALLSAAGADAKVARTEDDSVLVTVTSVAANFSVQFVSCDRQGRACRAALFDQMAEGVAPTFAQLNAFSQGSVLCRGYEDRPGRPHVVYATLLFADDTREHVVNQMAAWQGCIGEFRTFLKDPAGYLAAAP